MSWRHPVFGVTVLRAQILTFLRRDDLSRFSRIDRLSRHDGRPLIRLIPSLQDTYRGVIQLYEQGRLRAIPDGLWFRLERYLFPRWDVRSNIILLDIEDSNLPDLLRPGARVMTIMPLLGLDNNTYGKVVLYMRCYRNCIVYDSIVVLGLATQNWRPWNYDPVYFQLQHFLGAGLPREEVERLTNQLPRASTFPGGGARVRVARDIAAVAYWYALHWMTNPLPSVQVRRHPTAARRQDLFDFIFLQVGIPADQLL
jgi:hypothetical protein